MIPIRQVALDGQPMMQGICGRYHRALKVPESVIRGFGPICWAKIQADQEQERQESLPRTITDPRKAAVALLELREYVMLHLKRDRCFCGMPYERCELETYDYGDSKAGYVLDGFKYRQWAYLRCPKCKNDEALWKILKTDEERGIHAVKESGSPQEMAAPE